MGGKHSKSVDPVQTEMVPPYTKVKQSIILNTPSEIKEEIATTLDKNSLKKLAEVNCSFFNDTRIARLRALDFWKSNG